MAPLDSRTHKEPRVPGKAFLPAGLGKPRASHFSVDAVTARRGTSSQFEGRTIMGSYPRGHRTENGMNRFFKLRQDFMPAFKLQWKTTSPASIIVPQNQLDDLPEWASNHLSLKFAKNCEARFFQRPDDAITSAGATTSRPKRTSRAGQFRLELRAAHPGRCRANHENTIHFYEYTEPMRKFIDETEKDPNYEYFVASNRFRLVDGVPSKTRATCSSILPTSIRNAIPRGARATALPPHSRGQTASASPFGAVLPGRRNNPPDPKGRHTATRRLRPHSLSELPELFWISCARSQGKALRPRGAAARGRSQRAPFNPSCPPATSTMRFSAIS